VGVCIRRRGLPAVSWQSVNGQLSVGKLIAGGERALRLYSGINPILKRQDTGERAPPTHHGHSSMVWQPLRGQGADKRIRRERCRAARHIKGWDI
jgi:hypothetical protein